MADERLYQLALQAVPQIGPVQARALAEVFPSARAIFEASSAELSAIEGIGPLRAESICRFRDFSACERELRFIENHQIRTLYLRDPDYPQRLLHCYDPPTLLFVKGKAHLNATRIAAIVGTRNHSDYGEIMTELIVKELAGLGVTIVSGLAFGIDAIAHRTALQLGLPTLGVLAHGLDLIYPAAHRSLARRVVEGGALLSEFPSRTRPEKHRFPSRNRIVAGLSDITIVVESGIKGGSLITADIASGYHREVFAVPGRITDSGSAGCLELIRQHKALLLHHPGEIGEIMGWEALETEESSTPSGANASHQKPPNAEEQSGREIEACLRRQLQASADELCAMTGMPASMVSTTLFHLEMAGRVRLQPGGRYRLS